MVKSVSKNIHGQRIAFANEGETWVKDNDYLYFGQDLDVSFQWISSTSILQILPVTDDTGSIQFGDGTDDIDVKIFLGGASNYVEFNVGDSRMLLEGIDLKVLLGSSNEYAIFDVTNSRIELAVVGIYFTGTLTTGISFNDASFTPDTNRTDLAISIGARGDANELDITMAASSGQNFDPMQFNINVIGANPTSAGTINLIYALITHDSFDMSFLRLKCADWNIAIKKDVQDVYVYQGEVTFGAASISVGGEGAVMSLNMNAGASSVTGNLRGLIINCYGAGLPSSTSIGLEVRTDGGSATLTEGIRIWSVGGNSITNALLVRGTVAVFADFDDVSGEACTEDGSAATTWAGRIKVVTPDGNGAYINLYSTRN